MLRALQSSRAQALRSIAATQAPGAQRLSSTARPPAASMPVRSILIANRGEIALRVSRTASQHGIRTTTVYTEPDALAEHAHVTPYSVNIGPASAYLNVEKIIAAAKSEKCDSIHPGYGFLSENADFARRCAEEGLVFIGPPSSAIEAMGNKSEAKHIMLNAGVPCIPGYHGPDQSPEHLLSQAEATGFPILIKAVKGGGGKGMRIAASASEFSDMLASAKSEALSSFGDDTVLIERYITTPRHIEVQVFADAHGNCVALGERDCSVQRRHQKIIEESPAPSLDPSVRKDIWKKARDAALAVGYRGAGTVEFIFDNDTGEFFFMEMNTRLQVEHPVTEMVTNTDLVYWQLLVASGQPLPLMQEEIEAQMDGHSFEARIYAENPNMNFMPDSGTLLHLRTPTTSDTVRIDSGFRPGDEVSPHYDPMIAKLIVKGPTREAALLKLRAALEEYEVVGPSTNIEFLKALAAHPAFVAGDVETGFIPKHPELFAAEKIPAEVLSQAALSVLLAETAPARVEDPTTFIGGDIGFMTGVQRRKVVLVDPREDGERTAVTIEQCGRGVYNVAVGDNTGMVVKVGGTETAREEGKIVAYYAHMRMESTVVRRDDELFVFQCGRQYRLKLPRPQWLEKVLGEKDATNSVVAPMPCKVLRILVEAGQQVQKNQPLVVIESMKMETVIRSPHDGTISRAVHQQGDVVKAGVPLVLFKDADEDAS